MLQTSLTGFSSLGWKKASTGHKMLQRTLVNFHTSPRFLYLPELYLPGCRCRIRILLMSFVPGAATFRGIGSGLAPVGPSSNAQGRVQEILDPPRRMTPAGSGRMLLRHLRWLPLDPDCLQLDLSCRSRGRCSVNFIAGRFVHLSARLSRMRHGSPLPGNQSSIKDGQQHFMRDEDCLY